MVVLSARVKKVRSSCEVDLPDPVNQAIEAHKASLSALYSPMIKLNHDGEFLESRANQFIELYQKELLEAMKAAK